jgi:hypothetical protein
LFFHEKLGAGWVFLVIKVACSFIKEFRVLPQKDIWVAKILKTRLLLDLTFLRTGYLKGYACQFILLFYSVVYI